MSYCQGGILCHPRSMGINHSSIQSIQSYYLQSYLECEWIRRLTKLHCPHGERQCSVNNFRNDCQQLYPSSWIGQTRAKKLPKVATWQRCMTNYSVRQYWWCCCCCGCRAMTSVEAWNQSESTPVTNWLLLFTNWSFPRCVQRSHPLRQHRACSRPCDVRNC